MVQILKQYIVVVSGKFCITTFGIQTKLNQARSDSNAYVHKQTYLWCNTTSFMNEYDLMSLREFKEDMLEKCKWVSVPYFATLQLLPDWTVSEYEIRINMKEI